MPKYVDTTPPDWGVESASKNHAQPPGKRDPHVPHREIQKMAS